MKALKIFIIALLGATVMEAVSNAKEIADEIGAIHADPESEASVALNNAVDNYANGFTPQEYAIALKAAGLSATDCADHLASKMVANAEGSTISEVTAKLALQALRIKT